MVTVKFSATPSTLIETQGTALVFRFELDQAPPSGGLRLTVRGNVPQSLTQLDLFGLRFTGASAPPEGDFDFSGFDFTVTDRNATITVPIFQDTLNEGLQTVTYTLQPGSGYTVDATARSAIVNFVDNPSQVPVTPTPPPPPTPGIQPTAGDDILTGTEGKDTIDGLGGNDRISGLGGNDTLVGNRGNDVLLGGLGSDRLTGGRGRDTFALETGAGSDKILDFRNGQDRLGLAAGLAFGQLSFRQRGDNLLIRAGNDNLAVLTDVTRNQINRADFTSLA
jgi:Ca2+-binding RTX toxin-like protein